MIKRRRGKWQKKDRKKERLCMCVCWQIYQAIYRSCVSSGFLQPLSLLCLSALPCASPSGAGSYIRSLSRPSIMKLLVLPFCPRRSRFSHAHRQEKCISFFPQTHIETDKIIRKVHSLSSEDEAEGRGFPSPVFRSAPRSCEDHIF